MALRSTALLVGMLTFVVGAASPAVAPMDTWHDCDGEQGLLPVAAVPSTRSGHLEQAQPYAEEWSVHLGAGDLFAAALAMENPFVEGRLALADLACNAVCSSEAVLPATTLQQLRCVAPTDGTYLVRVSALNAGGDFTFAYAVLSP